LAFLTRSTSCFLFQEIACILQSREDIFGAMENVSAGTP
jgi:hypothetical protein